jgi:hypothetical protein
MPAIWLAGRRGHATPVAISLSEHGTPVTGCACEQLGTPATCLSGTYEVEWMEPVSQSREIRRTTRAIVDAYSTGFVLKAFARVSCRWASSRCVKCASKTSRQCLHKAYVGWHSWPGADGNARSCPQGITF